MLLLNLMNNLPSVLLIDDEHDFQEAFAESLRDRTKKELLQVNLASTAKQGLAIIKNNEQQGKRTLAFIDIILPDILGDELVREIDRNQTKLQGALISAHKSDRELQELQNQYDWLIDSFTKPLDKNKLENAIEFFLGNSQLLTFDYTALDRETANFIIKETEKIKTLMKQTVEGIIETGERLHKVKQKLKHGEFMTWVEKEIRCHYSTALHFMRVWQTFGDRKEQIAHIGINASVLYLLSAPSTPEKLRIDIVERAKAGNPVSFAEAKRLKKEYTQRKNSSQTSTESIKDDSVTTIEVIADSPSEVIKTETETTSTLAQDKFWTLGKHLLYCGSAQDVAFCDRLPATVALNIGFPNSATWKQETLFPIPAKSTLVFHSIFQDLDLVTLRNIIQRSIELCTESGEAILFSFLPYPEMLVLADNLKCHCFIAEPNLKRCQAIVYFWESMQLES